MSYGASPYDKDVNPGTALQRVDGFRYLTQNLSQAFDLAPTRPEARVRGDFLRRAQQKS